MADEKEQKNKHAGKDVAHPKREQEILAAWQRDKIFEKSLAQREGEKGKGEYVFYDGPPFATGLPHYGHILSSVIKDVIPRYWAMKGYHVRRRWGWDCHGLPIESLIEKELHISGKKDIEEKIGVDKFNAACATRVLQYTQEWKKMVDRIGRWVEFDNAYKTMDPEYMESVWWALKTMWDKELIYEGRKVLMYCPRCETPVSKAEIAMDNSYKDVTEEAVVVRFRVMNQELRIKEGRHVIASEAKQSRDSGSPRRPEYRASRDDVSEGASNWLPTDAPVYLLAWTTTPWTLPGNVALAVGEEIDYVLVKEGEAYYIVAEARLENVFAGRVHEVVKKMRGIDLLGLQYEPLFDVPAIREFVGTGLGLSVPSREGEVKANVYSLLPADFVTTEDGTGIVHTAVMYGEDDYNLGVEFKLPMVPLLDAAGRFNQNAPELLQGKYIKKAAHVQEVHATKLILDYLKEKDLLFSSEQYTHSYPHCWRCDTALIYNAISAWFINIQQIKPRMLELNDKINWYPEHLKEGRFKNILETAPDWNISRNRYWATPLPFWKCEGVGENQESRNKNQGGCESVACIGSVAELKEKAINFDEVFTSDNVADLDLHKHVVDKVKLRCEKCGGVMTRIPEVIDCWVESSSMPFAEFHYPFAKGSKEIFAERVKGEGKFIAEYINQTRAWFYYMHAMGAALENDGQGDAIYGDNTAFTNVVTTGVILNEKGEKMSKSKQNYPDPWMIIEKYGVDALRYYLMSSPVMKADDLNFNEREVDEVYKKVILILRNVLAFWEMYAGDSSLRAKRSNPDDLQVGHVMDKWIVARTNQFVREMTAQMDTYQVTEATRSIAPFADDLSTWYLRRSRERLKVGTGLGLSNAGEAQDALEVLRWVLLTIAKVIAPVMPYLAEHVYGVAGGQKESVHLEEWPGEESQELRVKNQGILGDMERIRKIAGYVHAQRKARGIRARQPLAELQMDDESWIEKGFINQYKHILSEELNIKKVVFGTLQVHGSMEGVNPDDAYGVGAIAIEWQITPDLRIEGIAADMMRYIADARKKAGMSMGDKASAVVALSDETIKKAIEAHKETIIRETGLTSLGFGAVESEPVKVEGKEVRIEVHKA